MNRAKQIQTFGGYPHRCGTACGSEWVHGHKFSSITHQFIKQRLPII